MLIFSHWMDIIWWYLWSCWEYWIKILHKTFHFNNFVIFPIDSVIDRMHYDTDKTWYSFRFGVRSKPAKWISVFPQKITALLALCLCIVLQLIFLSITCQTIDFVISLTDIWYLIMFWRRCQLWDKARARNKLFACENNECTLWRHVQCQ